MTKRRDDSGEHAAVQHATPEVEGDGEALLSTTEAALALNVHRDTLRDWVDRELVTPDKRTLGGARRGGHLRWKQSTVRAIAQRMAAGTLHAGDSVAPPAA